MEQNRNLQDSFDQLQAEAKFEADQARQELVDRQREVDQLKAEVLVTEPFHFTLIPLNCSHCFISGSKFFFPFFSAGFKQFVAS